MTNKQPLDKKINKHAIKSEDCILVEHVKSSLSNLKKRLKEASENNDWEFASNDGQEDGFITISGEEFIDKLFSEEIGSGLLEGENDK